MVAVVVNIIQGEVSVAYCEANSCDVIRRNR